MARHFHSSDERFCGSEELGRAFTFNPNDVSCTKCQSRDRLALSESGRKVLEELGEAA